MEIKFSLTEAVTHKDVKVDCSEHCLPVKYWSPTTVLSSEKVPGRPKTNIVDARKKIDYADITKLKGKKGQTGWYYEICETKKVSRSGWRMNLRKVNQLIS